jgi:hypothetical protein
MCPLTCWQSRVSRNGTSPLHLRENAEFVEEMQDAAFALVSDGTYIGPLPCEGHARQHGIVSGFLAGLSSGLIAAWGIARVLPTSRVVAGYADTSPGQPPCDRPGVDRRGVDDVVRERACTRDHQRRRRIDQGLGVSGLRTVAVGSRHADLGASVVFFKICPVVLTSYAGLLLAASWV